MIIMIGGECWMKKIFGITIGGLQHKILNLVLMVFIATIGCVIVVSTIKTKQLSSVVNNTRVEQQEAIEDSSVKTLLMSVDSSMTKTNALQAYIADDMFSDLRSDVSTLQALAEEIFSQKNDIGKAAFELPDKTKAGQYTPQVLFESGVDYESSELLGIAARMAAPMTAMCSKAEYMDNCYIGLADGTFFLVDDHPENKYDENGELIHIAVRERPWYINAVESGEVCFSGVISDTYSGASCVTCSAPVYVNGELIGVVAIDLFLDSMEEYVNESAKSGGFICIVNDNGNVVFAPEGNPLFEVSLSEDAEDLRKSDNAELADFISSALTASTGMKTVNAGGTDYYMVGSPMSTVGWAVVSVVEKELIEQPAKELIAEYDRINERSSEEYAGSAGKLQKRAAIAVFLIFIAGILISRFVAGRILKPIEAMTGDVIDGAETGKLFEMKDVYRTNDEIQVLAESIDDLSKKTKKYIEDITAITAENERIGTELFLATRIQESMLPHIFPPFPDKHEFEIYAIMDPAREVGGDFYDFFLIDQDHLCLVMADVSGKGIPGALFMMISKTIIQSSAVLGSSASDILERANAALCANNQADMFVTVWLGILELSTGKLSCANAGHEYPALKRKNGKFELYKDKHGFVLGGMDGMKYKEYTIELNEGDSLFLYTDGVPEATDAQQEMFGNDRMIEALNKDENANPYEVLGNVREAVSDFVGDAEQFDDLTMLCIEYRGADAEQEENKQA